MLITLESDVSVLGGQRERFAQVYLPVDERERLAAMADVRRRDTFLLGRVMLRSTLAEQLACPPRRIDIRQEVGGRPVLANDSWRFSISHCGDQVLLVLSDDCTALGVDLERADGDRNWRKLAAGRLPQELAEVVVQAPLGAAAARFCTYWTLLEAVAKARGCSVLSRDNFPLASELARCGSGGKALKQVAWRWLHQVQGGWHRSIVWHGKSAAPSWQPWEVPA
jgi:phosphopantetheinyl transferase